MVSSVKHIRKRSRSNVKYVTPPTPRSPSNVVRLPSQAPGGSENEGHFGGKVGHCNPPKSGQFKKGQSGNPKGRPKGSKTAQSLDMVVRAEWEARLAVLEDGIRVERSAPEVALMKLRQIALNGDRQSLKLYLELILKYGSQQDADQVEEILSDVDEEILQTLLASHKKTKSIK